MPSDITMHPLSPAKPTLTCVAFGLILLGAAPGNTRADIVLEWNEAMTHYAEGLPQPSTPPVELRAYAMAHLALFNAVERALNTRQHAEAAGAQAAHDVLVQALPGGTAGFDALLAKQLAAIPDGPEKIAALGIGTEAATRILTERAHDGAAAIDGPYHPGDKPGDYRFTPPFDGPPFNGLAIFPNLHKMSPFILQSADQFRAPAPPSLRSTAYAFDFNEVEVLGALDSKVRTADQTECARFWYEMTHFSWNRIARLLAAGHPDSLLEHARLFAVLNLAMTDAFIAGFDTKYAYNFWRPFTAIRAAETDGNPLTAADPAWEPLMTTPPMPDHVSTHAVAGAAATAVLIWFFHGDEHTFTLTSTMRTEFPDLQPRTFHRISDAATENAFSRVCAGIHFRSACLAGLEQGRTIGEWVVQHAPCAANR
jgi:hypothetical protein